MKHSRKASEGYFEIDHRMSPGDDTVPEGQRLEIAVLRCDHCHRIILKNPLRVRPSIWFFCNKCYGAVCEYCGDPIITGCTNLDAMLDALQEQAFTALNIKEI